MSVDMSRGELLHLVSVMEGELQARDVSIAVLKVKYLEMPCYETLGMIVSLLVVL